MARTILVTQLFCDPQDTTVLPSTGFSFPDCGPQIQIATTSTPQQYLVTASGPMDGHVILALAATEAEIGRVTLDAAGKGSTNIRLGFGEYEITAVAVDFQDRRSHPAILTGIVARPEEEGDAAATGIVILAMAGGAWWFVRRRRARRAM